MTAPLLEFDDLGVDLDDRALVESISLSVTPGERVGIIGESGSGKSLTALAALGLLAHPLRARGAVRVRSSEGVVDAVTASQRTLDGVRGTVLGAVFQEPLASLDPLMRVGGQLAWPLRRHRGLRGDELKRAVLDALADVKLAEPERVARSYIHEISGGQRQRVAIALALAGSPDLLIADEPTTALDVTVQAGVLDLLQREVTERGMALLFISHDLPVVTRMTDRVLVMKGGRQIEVADTATLVSAPVEPYTRELVAASRALDDLLPKETR
ncbi:ATP-binding cassette domain-containing protein [Microbacterium sp. Leaf179]|uniref:ATP-binding cassette domain-containing protein n=1 Tax=Microbacterium sp. Leaf179 TaxID=1736288 RepID=UPI0006F47D83|nr:ABC transporter ATP-binding protein [Microbacterium sp. Leaf179]KQR86319.1 ABC transporter ATP-binding protein [Microbacterium sp. Leaf179]